MGWRSCHCHILAWPQEQIWLGTMKEWRSNRQKCWACVSWAIWWRTCSTPEAHRFYFVQANREDGFSPTAGQGPGLDGLNRSSFWRATVLRLYTASGECHSGRFLENCQHSPADQEGTTAIALYRGLRLWGRWRGCTHFSSTYSLRASSAP